MKHITVSNAEAARYADSCERFIDDKGLLGFACARNARKLTDACLEYIRARSSALEELGDAVTDADGHTTGYRIDANHENFGIFIARMSPLDSIEVGAEVMTVPPSEVIGKISGRDAMTIEWMIEDDGR